VSEKKKNYFSVVKVIPVLQLVVGT